MARLLRVGRLPYNVILAYATNATTVSQTITQENLNGILREVIITTPGTVDSSATVTVNVLDADSNVVYAKTGVAANTTSINLLTQDLSVPLSGNITLQVVFSASQTANRTTKVVLLVDRG